MTIDWETLAYALAPAIKIAADLSTEKATAPLIARITALEEALGFGDVLEDEDDEVIREQ